MKEEEPNEAIEVEYTNTNVTINEENSFKNSKIFIKNLDEADEILIIPPDGGWGWVVVTGSFIIFLITEGIIYAFGIFFNDIGNTLKCNRSQISLIGALKTGCICFSGPFSAALINKYGYRFVGIVGTIIASVATAISALFNDMTLLILTYSVAGGIGFGMLYISAVIVLGFYFERWRSLATGISLCGAGVGCVIVPSILTLILQEFGWRFTFIIKGIILALCGICTLAFKPLKPTTLEASQLSLPRMYSTLLEEDIQIESSKVKLMESSTTTILKPQKMDRNDSSVTVFHTVGSKTSKKGIRTSKMLSPVKEIESETSSSTSRKFNCRKFRVNCRQCCRRNKNFTQPTQLENNASISVRPLYRNDIFYHGSMNLIPEYRRSMQSKTFSTKSRLLNYSMSVTKTNTTIENSSKICSNHINIVLATMLDVRLMKLPYFPLLILNAVFTSIGFFVPYMFIIDRAIDNGMTEKECFWLISTIGATNTIGRILCGTIVLLPQICPVKLTAILLTIGGIATILSDLSFKVWYQFLYAAIYGFSIASISTLRTVIIVQVLGLSKLTNAMGMIMLAQGFATLAGIWTAGLLRDALGDYKWTFYCAGISITVSGLVLLCVKKISSNERNEIPEKN